MSIPQQVWLPKRRLKRIDSSPEKDDMRWKSSPQYIEKEPLSIKVEPEDYSNDEGCRTEPSDVDEKPLKSRKRKQEVFCSFCGDSFKCRRALKRHKKTVHPDKKWNDGVLKCNTYLAVKSVCILNFILLAFHL